MLSWHLSRGNEKNHENLIHNDICGPTVELESPDYGADSRSSMYCEVGFKH
jgi:hypothetical protein